MNEKGIKAVELSDEDIEKAVGGKKNHSHTCKVYADSAKLNYMSVGQEFCQRACPFKHECSQGITKVSDERVEHALNVWFSDPNCFTDGKWKDL